MILLLLAAVDIDAALLKAWGGPVAQADDVTFLRRASLDLIGVIPTPEEVRAFDGNRARLVDRLLADPRFVAHWTDVFDGLLLTRAHKVKKVDRGEFRAWITKTLEERWGWDRFARELLVANGGDGAANWLLSFDNNAQDLTGTVSRTFLSVQIQCAQCHDHVTEKWKQKDFQGFAAYFADVRVRRGDGGFEVSDAKTHAPRKKDRDDEMIVAVHNAEPRALDGTQPQGVTRRRAIAEWLTGRDNPWFARAAVNRFWAYFLGHGFYEPFDDLREKNAPVLPDLHDALSRDFATNGFDLRRLFRAICVSAAYGAAPGTAPLFAKFQPRLLDTDQLFGSLVQATGVDDDLVAKARKQFNFAFNVDDESASRHVRSPTLAQALLMMNGALTSRGLKKVVAAVNDVDDAYVTVLSRPATDDERRRWKGTGKEDLLWTLLTSAEFAFNH